LSLLGNFRNAKNIPSLLEEHVSDDKFKKSNSYGIDKFSFGIKEQIFMLIEGVALTLLGYLPFAWDLSYTWCDNIGLIKSDSSLLYIEIMSTIMFMFILTIHDTIVGLPFSIYRNFVVEEKHGFNKSTFGLFMKDKLIGLALSLGIGSPVMAALVYIIRLGGIYI
jgi:STE24 endopeptidase